ncbi:MAG: DUF2384 domain-containing protein [Gammaproteobacteria bacterium]|nr:DUF2384 domain-containing protein [Gammaproteobacteria bacterium]
MTLDEQIILTTRIMAILDGWGMSSADIISLLALPEKTPTRALRRYRENTPFPVTPELSERIEHIIGITDALRTSYPHNPQMGKIWIRQRSKKLQNQIPLQIIVENGLDGVIEVRKHLDCSYDWHKNP